MKKISVVIAGRHSTSICLEEEFFFELKRLAYIRHQSINDIITEIDKTKRTSNLSSAIRIFILKEVMKEVQKH
ncbi:MAG: ribbon-helix-helix domain-containing protein [Alphaproteobacteria bacterium]|nr:ribbon-helix-helix domain-containing protein [Alphaproteobacteria bacterium]